MFNLRDKKKAKSFQKIYFPRTRHLIIKILFNGYLHWKEYYLNLLTKINVKYKITKSDLCGAQCRENRFSNTLLIKP